MIRYTLSAISGLALTLVSTFIGERTTSASYPDILGCEEGCIVTATGWPLIFVRDYTGMSVVNTAHIVEVWLAADQLDWMPFLINVMFWSGLTLASVSFLWRNTRGQADRPASNGE